MHAFRILRWFQCKIRFKIFHFSGKYRTFRIFLEIKSEISHCAKCELEFNYSNFQCKTIKISGSDIPIVAIMSIEFTGRGKLLWHLSTLMNWVSLHHVYADKLYESSLWTRRVQTVLSVNPYWQISGKFLRPFYWKTHPSKFMSNYLVFFLNRVVS